VPDIKRDERHQRGEPVAMIDFVATLFDRAAQAAQGDRGVEIVRVGVELIEQIKKIGR
jgi:hypothetical protein